MKNGRLAPWTVLASLMMLIATAAQFVGAANLPIDNVDRTIYIAPDQSGKQAGTKGGGQEDPVIWRPWETWVVNGEYPLAHVQLEFPGYVTSTAGATNAIKVRARMANLFDRTSETGQSFPLQSDAVYVFETTNSLGQPVSLTGSVNLILQYYDHPTDELTDCVNFSNDVVHKPLGMQVVRDLLQGSPVNFDFVTGAVTTTTTTTLNSHGRAYTIRRNNVTNLTPGGTGTWGAVSPLG